MEQEAGYFNANLANLANLYFRVIRAIRKIRIEIITERSLCSVVRWMAAHSLRGRRRRRAGGWALPPVPLSALAIAHYDSGTMGYSNGTLTGARCDSRLFVAF